MPTACAKPSTSSTRRAPPSRSTRRRTCCWRPWRRDWNGCWRADGGRSVGAAALQDDADGLEQQADIAPEGPVRDVEVVEFDHLLERDPRPPQHLPQARHPRGEVEAVACVAVDATVLVLDERTRADEAHVAPKNVPQLRQLVDAQVAQDATDARDPRVGVEVQPV